MAASTQKSKAEAFRALHMGPDTFVIPNPPDAGTARILALLGFKALATTSGGFAFSMGRQDGPGLVSREETLENARSIVEATDLPVSADLQNCFGDDPEDVAETIRKAAEVGLVGGSVEDATGDAQHPIYEHLLSVDRVAAAVAAARGLPFPFIVTARAENFLHGRRDLDDTIRRLQAYAEAGADVLFAPGLPNLDAVRAVCAAVAPLPVNVLAGGKHMSVADLSAAGVRRISVGSSLTRAAFGAFTRAAREIAEKGTFAFNDEAIPFAELSAFMREKL
jgi:2-methylisocitrate lyase-like PEP mutase family enzyme